MHIANTIAENTYVKAGDIIGTIASSYAQPDSLFYTMSLF